MSISIVIPLASPENNLGSRWGDQELKYCLRSIEKHLTGYGHIFIIGHKPAFLNDKVIHIPASDEDKTFWKERNIFNKIMIACGDERVTEDFLFMNDDHFLLCNFIGNGFPYYYSGYLMEYSDRPDQYGNSAKNTYDIMKVKNELARYWDIHCPIIYNKTMFVQLSVYDWNKKYGYCIKSLYCEHHNIDAYYGEDTGWEYPDLKINEAISSTLINKLIDGRLFFSIGNRAFDGGIVNVLGELYPSRSKYER